MKNLWKKSAVVMTAIASLTTVFALSSIAYGQFGQFDINKINPIDAQPVKKIDPNAIQPIDQNINLFNQVPEENPIITAANAMPVFNSLEIENDLSVGGTLTADTIEGEDVNVRNMTVSGLLEVQGNIDLNIRRVEVDFNSNRTGQTVTTAPCPYNKMPLSCEYRFEEGLNLVQGSYAAPRHFWDDSNGCEMAHYSLANQRVSGTLIATCI